MHNRYNPKAKEMKTWVEGRERNWKSRTENSQQPVVQEVTVGLKSRTSE